jgi:hypothetical protein
MRSSGVQIIGDGLIEGPRPGAGICPMAAIRNCPGRRTRSRNVTGRQMSSVADPPICVRAAARCWARCGVHIGCSGRHGQPGRHRRLACISAARARQDGCDGHFRLRRSFFPCLNRAYSTTFGLSFHDGSDAQVASRHRYRSALQPTSTAQEPVNMPGSRKREVHVVGLTWKQASRLSRSRASEPMNFRAWPTAGRGSP